MKRLCLAVAALWCISISAIAQEVIPDFYKGPGLDPNRSSVNQNFNEHVDPFNGSLQVHYVDVSVPGNGGFDIQVTRSYNSAAVNEANPNTFFGSAGVGWSVHFGRVLYKATIGPCGGRLYTDVLRDPVLELPDGSTQILAGTPTGSPTLISTQRWRADCSGSGVVVYSPDGVRYDMMQSVGMPTSGTQALAALYTTKITDRNGNYANIAYLQAGSPEVSSVTAGPGDARRIDFSYFPLGGEATRRINTITSSDSTGNRVYTYGYQAIAGGFGGFQLTSVTRPGGTQWQYGYLGNLNGTVPGGFQLNRVTYPEGGTISYGYGSSSNDYVYFDSVSNAQSRTAVVKTKTTSDGGSWNFSYAPGAIGSYDTTTVNAPSGTTVYKHAGPNYAPSGSLWMVGLLMQKQVGASQTETYGWTPQGISPQQLKRPGAWLSTRFDSNMNAPMLSSKIIVRDGATHSTTFSGFDPYGNPTSVVESGPNGGSRSTTLTYFQNLSLWILKQLKNQTVSGGVQITRSFDTLGRLQSVTQDGVTTTFVPNSDGSVGQATFPRGLVHTYSSYKRGIPQTETQPEGVSLSRVVSDSGNLLSETNGRGYTNSYTYDGLNRITRITPPVGNLTTISYGQTTKSASRGSLTESTQYDGFGRPISVALGGIVRTYSHDPLGRMTFASNPSAAVGTSYQYDILDRVRFVTNAGGTDRLISFGASSKSVRDERGNSTIYNFRAYGDPGQQLLMSITAPDSSTNVVIGRNSRGLVETISQGGFTRTYGYDSRAFLTSVDNPETGVTIYGRDDANNMVSRKVGVSGTTIFGYDGQNRLKSVIYPGATPSVAKTYTKTNKLETVTSSVAARVYGYDGNENLKSESLTSDATSLAMIYDYNGNDQLSSLTYPRSGRVVSYGPDPLGRPTQVSGFVSSVGYWPSGQISQIAYANGTTSTYGQDPNRLWPSYFQTAKGATAYLSSSYGYDGLGNLKSVTDSVDSSYNRTLDYDAVNRLKIASGPWGSGLLTYDGAGNLRSQTFGSVALSYSYVDGKNRLNSVSGSRTATYSYDDYGDITGTGSKTFNYDGAPNLTCANCNDPATNTQYQYDGLNQRVSVLKGGVKTYEFYASNGSLLAELTPSLSNRLAEYIYLGGKRVATIGPAPSTISLPAQSLTAVAGQAVTFTATLGGAAPTGAVSFYDGSTLLGTASVVSGKASVTTTFQTVGAHTFTANYSGDAANFGSSTTATVTVLSSTTITGPAGGPSLTAVAGKPTTLSATVNGNSPTGTMSFYDGSTLLGTANLVSGTGSINTSISSVGTHTITIVYSGDANNAASTATVTLNVTLPPEQLIPILQMLLDD